MSQSSPMAYVAFDGDRRIAFGELREVARAAKERLEKHKHASILVFDDTSGPIDLDLRGSVEDVLARLPKLTAAPMELEAGLAAPRGPGRPKLGVVAREITLLPRWFRPLRLPRCCDEERWLPSLLSRSR